MSGDYLPNCAGGHLQSSKPTAVLDLSDISILLPLANHPLLKTAFTWADMHWHLHNLLVTGNSIIPSTV